MIDYTLQINDNEPLDIQLGILFDRIYDECNKRKISISIKSKKGWYFKCNPKVK